MSLKNDKSLGQHWLRDRFILSTIADFAEINTEDTILEVGPGLGTLTSELLRRAKKVVAVEFDHNLASKLPGQFPGKNLEVIESDILKFDLSVLPKGYKVVANIPYYITSKIVQLLVTASNKPSEIVLLVQKEVAERLAAKPGDMSILGISAQIYAETYLGDIVAAEYFTPPPKVDSQIVVLKVRDKPLVCEADNSVFFKVVKAGFSAKRKMLRSSLAGGLRMTKSKVETLLEKSKINPTSRAEDLSIDDWIRLTKVF